MPKRSRKKKPTDPNELAASIVHEATAETPTKPKKKNPAAVVRGKLGGGKGGLARATKLSKERRQEIASKAAKTRWAKRKKAP